MKALTPSPSPKLGEGCPIKGYLEGGNDIELAGLLPCDSIHSRVLLYYYRTYEQVLYLAVPLNTYNDFFSKNLALLNHGMNLPHAKAQRRKEKKF